MVIGTLHPDDVLFFEEVSATMRRVAQHYALPLRTITALPMPEQGLADRLGDCASTGDIRLVMRATVDGEWCPEPRTPERVWETAAHELAHLRHMNHGEAFREFHEELIEQMRNFREDHRDRVLRKLLKMRASSESEAAIGNIEAAEAFASAINRMMLEHELRPSDLEYARVQADDPVVEIMVDMSKHRIEKKRSRIAWQESLARIVAKGHLCQFLLRTGSNQIWFAGTRSHATVAEYVYGILVSTADKMATTAYYRFESQCRARNEQHLARGYRASWLAAFIERVGERLEEIKRAAVQDVPEAERGMALMRLDGALVKVKTYIDDKFKGRRGAYALNHTHSNHAEGRAHGRAAADSMPIGRKGVAGGSARGLLK